VALLRPTLVLSMRDRCEEGAVDRQAHWEHIYRAKASTELSWYQQESRLSLELIRQVVTDYNDPIIDVGGGASPLVDGLLSAGYRSVTVLDLADAALKQAQTRLGALAPRITWIVADILEAVLPTSAYAFWHDRAVFHFLTDPRDRTRYVAQVRRAVRPGGYVLVASFAADGPTHCSGLEVARYSPKELHAQFGADFRLVESVRETHTTPGGSTQPFLYCVCRVGGQDS
jgi:ubiquinone/menaquinone biosynthesis C-methylase UbiE